MYTNRQTRTKSQSPASQIARVSLASLQGVETQAQMLATVGNVLSSTVRGQILLLLVRHSELTITALAVLTQVSVTLTSHHVARLKQVGLIQLHASGRLQQACLTEASFELMPQVLRIARGLRAAQALHARREQPDGAV